MERSAPEELSRKTAEVIVGLFDRLNEGEITTREAHIAATAAFNSVSGMINRETLELITQAMREWS